MVHHLVYGCIKSKSDIMCDGECNPLCGVRGGGTGTGQNKIKSLCMC